MGDSGTSVYKYSDNNGILIYVGITAQGQTRNQQHNNSKDWWRFVASQEVEHFGSRDEARAREASLIGTFRPPFNRHHNKDYEQIRVAYLAFADESSLERNPHKLFHQRDGKFQLIGSSSDPVLQSFFLAPEDSPVTSGLRLALGVKVPVYWNGLQIGKVASLRTVKSIVQVTIRVRRTMRGLVKSHGGYARLRLVSPKKPVVVEFRSLHLTCDHILPIWKDRPKKERLQPSTE